MSTSLLLNNIVPGSTVGIFAAEYTPEGVAKTREQLYVAQVDASQLCCTVDAGGNDLLIRVRKPGWKPFSATINTGFTEGTACLYVAQSEDERVHSPQEHNEAADEGPAPWTDEPDLWTNVSA